MKNWIFLIMMLVGAQVFSQGVNISLVSEMIQTGSVVGKVLDANDPDMPLVFASVVVKEVEQHVETDNEGVFSFQLSPGSYTLEVAFIGYELQEISFEVFGGEKAQKKVLLQPLKIQSAQQVELIDQYDL